MALLLTIFCHSPPAALASTYGIVFGVGATVTVVQCRTLLSPGLQVIVLSLEKGTSVSLR